MADRDRRPGRGLVAHERRTETTRIGKSVADSTVPRQELSLPPKITMVQMKRFSLYATRTILSGGGDEIVELAKTTCGNSRSNNGIKGLRQLARRSCSRRARLRTEAP
jgi:hypothetical protein